MFGEKYPDPVRVVSVGTADPLTLTDATRPVEFCGGTHLSRTAEVGLFKIISEESVAKGVRRITALTGTGAVEWAQQADALLRSASGVLRVPPEQVPERAEALQKEIKQLRKRPAGGGGAGGAELREVARSPAGPVLVGKVAAGEAGAMRSVCDRERQKGAGAVLLGGADEEKLTLVAMVSEELVSSNGLKAGDWIRHVAERIGGRGGGKPTMAQGGAKDPARLDEALSAAGEWVGERLS
jgi:alanyl-tRNA synthetase